MIDGAIRDLAQIRRSRLPVFACGAVPNAGGAEYTGETGIPIQCGGAVVSPGDWILSDEDGVVVTPAGRLEAALERAEALLKVERAIYAEVRKGKDLGELLHDELLKVIYFRWTAADAIQVQRARLIQWAGQSCEIDYRRRFDYES